MSFKTSITFLSCVIGLRTALSLDPSTKLIPSNTEQSQSEPATTLPTPTSVPKVSTTYSPTSTTSTDVAQKSTQHLTMSQKSTQQTTEAQIYTQQIPSINAASKKSLDIFTVINELTSNVSMTNETLEYLINVIGDTNNPYHVFLPTLLAIDTRTPIALLKKVLVHPDYSVKMLDALAKDTPLAKLVLKPVFDNSTVTADILPMIFSSEKLTLKLLEMLAAKPKLAQIVLEGMVKRIDVVLPILSNYSQLIHDIVTGVIGNNISVVDNALEFIGNLSLPTDNLLGTLMSNPSLVDSLTPILKEILNSPILGNYLFTKFLENKQLVENIQKVLFSSPEILGTVSNFKVDPFVLEQLLGLVLQHPLFANQLLGQILSQPEIVVKLVALVIDGTILKQLYRYTWCNVWC